MSVLFYPESIRILGRDANGNNVMLCEMAVDDIANLPAANAFISDGYVLSIGCTATAINDNSKHRLNGAGTWVQIVAGNSSYTRAEINEMFSDIDAEILTITPALISVVNEGSKNKCKITATNQILRNVTFTFDDESGTFTANGTANGTDSIMISDLITTTEEMFLTGTPPDASGYNVRFGSSATYRDTGNGVAIPPGITNRIYFAFNSGTVFNNVTIQPMICAVSKRNISQSFVPYAPTNRQLYEMILQLQGG